jgi:hypothetical protein
MNARINCSRWLIGIGICAMLVGAIDPLEGWVIVLPGVGAVALGELVGKSRHTALLGWALGLAAFGVVAMIALSLWGGIGGKSGHSLWWGIFILPYPAGWILALVGAVRSLVESRRPWTAAS